MDGRLGPEALSDFLGSFRPFGGFSSFHACFIGEGRDVRPRGGWKTGTTGPSHYAETSASRLCSICFLTLPGSARSASRSS
jgi:hypothetical protein